MLRRRTANSTLDEVSREPSEISLLRPDPPCGRDLMLHLTPRLIQSSALKTITQAMSMQGLD